MQRGGVGQMSEFVAFAVVLAFAVVAMLLDEIG